MSDEVSVTSESPTASLRFNGGVLEQMFIVGHSDGSSVPTWKPVPSVPEVDDKVEPV